MTQNSLRPAIEFQNVSKSFVAWHDRPSSLKSLLSQIVTFNFKFGHKERHEVLKNITMKINMGDFVGIMGRNGAGKSTLLKLITGIYQPTSGNILTHGRIAPLLELGAGFASELTGYENIFLNGSIQGYGKKLIEERLQSIIDFSELGADIERPVRNYSSGMLVRLGFSIAVHLDAPIILLDEVLAVGDVGFQSKCLKKINEMHAEGRTIILVTHDPGQVEKFCNRCIVFDKEAVLFDGKPSDGTPYYRRLFDRAAQPTP